MAALRNGLLKEGAMMENENRTLGLEITPLAAFS